MPENESMEGGDHLDEQCRSIDEDMIELHAMGRLREGSISRHLDTCDTCRARVADHRAYIETLKRGLQDT